MKNRKALNIILYTVTAILCVVMLASLCLYYTAERCQPEIETALIGAKDVCNIALPLIGICVMLIVISYRSKHGHSEKK